MINSFLKSIPILILLLVFPELQAQYRDFRSWWNVEISREISKNLDLGVEASQRFKENSLAYDRSVITGTLKYELFDDFSVRGGYRYLVVQNRGIFESRYRIHAGIQYGKNIESFSFRIRERIQYGFDDLQSINDFIIQKTISRTRLKAAYAVFGTPFEVHVSYELFTDLNNVRGLLPVANRYMLGLEYDFLHKGSLDISYLIEQEINSVNPLLSNILLVTYAYDL